MATCVRGVLAPQLQLSQHLAQQQPEQLVFCQCTEMAKCEGAACATAATVSSVCVRV
jgi:hypothetical protein